MIKIAVSTDGDMVSPHFGRCASFTLAEIEEGKVLKKEVISNPGDAPGFLPQFLSEKGVGYVISGRVGQRAQKLFEEKGIKTIVGISGKVEEVIEEFAKGKLEEKLEGGD